MKFDNLERVLSFYNLLYDFTLKKLIFKLHLFSFLLARNNVKAPSLLGVLLVGLMPLCCKADDENLNVISLSITINRELHPQS